jgi:C_GCAxxG_C_C family probable redox protein
MLDTAAARSRQLFESGLYCAESVLLAIAEAKGVQSALIPKIATGFCSGLARTCGTCGAVSGAILAINLFTGRSIPGAPVDQNYTAVRKLLAAFEGEFGSTNCARLLGCDLGTEEGQKHFREHNLFEQCKSFTAEATRTALRIIEEIE